MIYVDTIGKIDMCGHYIICKRIEVEGITFRCCVNTFPDSILWNFHGIMSCLVSHQNTKDVNRSGKHIYHSGLENSVLYVNL